MKIGIISFHRAYNCGAALQAFALSQYLKSLGHNPVFPDINSIGATRAHFPKTKLTLTPMCEAIKSIVWYCGLELLNIGYEDVRRHRYRRFISNTITTIHGREFEQDKSISCLIFGSDQIWNQMITLDYTPLFLGETDTTHKKISYAASFGDVTSTEEFLSRVKNATKTFDALSVREPSPVDLTDKYNRTAQLVCDPTLLIKQPAYDAVAYQNIMCKNPFLFAYMVSSNPETISLAEKVAKVLNLHIVCIDACQRGLWRCKRHTNLCCSPDRFLAYMRDATCVITNSFHGTAFSIIYKKPFAYCPPIQNNSKPIRVQSLLNQLSLCDRIVQYDHDVVSATVRVLKQQLPIDLDQRVEQAVCTSKSWITEALDSI